MRPVFVSACFYGGQKKTEAIMTSVLYFTFQYQVKRGLNLYQTASEY